MLLLLLVTASTVLNIASGSAEIATFELLEPELNEEGNLAALDTGSTE